MRLQKSGAFLIIICMLLLGLAVVYAQNEREIALEVYFQQESLSLVVTGASNAEGLSISLGDFGVVVSLSGDRYVLELADYFGFEPGFDRVEIGTCITIKAVDTNPPLPLPCRLPDKVIKEAEVLGGDRFWVDDDGQFRLVTFSNGYTDQNCHPTPDRCVIRFTQDGVPVPTNESGGLPEPGRENHVLVAERASSEVGDNLMWMVSGNGRTISVRPEDCVPGSPHYGPPEEAEINPNGVTLYFTCDLNRGFVNFYAYVDHPNLTPEITIDFTSLPVDPDSPDVIVVTDVAGSVKAEMSVVRSGPGTDYVPDSQLPAIWLDTEVIIERQWVDPETRQQWYRVTVVDRGHTAWVFAENLDADLRGNEVVQWALESELPQTPTPIPTMDSDGDRVPDHLDICPGSPASRRSECGDQGVGINENTAIAPAPTEIFPTRAPTQPPIEPTQEPATFSPEPATFTPEPATFTPEPVVDDTCVLTPNNTSGANIRTGPGTCYDAVGGGFAHGTSASPVNQAFANGALWWRLAPNRWVADSAVSQAGVCDSVAGFTDFQPCPDDGGEDDTDDDNTGEDDTDNGDDDGNGGGDACDGVAVYFPPNRTFVTNVNGDGTLPYVTQVNIDVECLQPGQEVWVIVHPANDRYYAYGPKSGDGPEWVQLGTDEWNSCGLRFDLTVIVVEANSLTNPDNIYDTMPSSITSVGVASEKKGGGACPPPTSTP